MLLLPLIALEGIFLYMLKLVPSPCDAEFNYMWMKKKYL